MAYDVKVINELVQRKRSVTADTDLRLARYFGLSEGFFLGLQADFDPMQRRRRICPAISVSCSSPTHLKMPPGLDGGVRRLPESCQEKAGTALAGLTEQAIQLESYSYI